MANKEKLKSTVSILLDLRTKHEDNAHKYFLFFMIFLGILIIDLCFLFVMKRQRINILEWSGIWIIILAAGFFIKDYWLQRKEVETIDNFYLGYQYKLINKHNGKQKE